jgi:glucose/arabinose dehydrogenase
VVRAGALQYVPANPTRSKVLLGRLGRVFDPSRRSDRSTTGSRRPAGHPLEVPVGFTIQEAAAGLAAPRFMAIDPADGTVVYGSHTTSQVVRLRDWNGDGRFDQAQTIAGGLAAVHSVAFVGGQLYAAAEDRLVRLSSFDASGAARQVDQIAALPSGAKDLYGHRTRTVALGPDGKLYVSVGSSCDVCGGHAAARGDPADEPGRQRRGEVFAAGCATPSASTGGRSRASCGRGHGPQQPRQNRVSDELNLLEQGKRYGWPFCYDDNVPNPEFNDPARCAGATAPSMKVPAALGAARPGVHNRPAFPAAYQGDALVAFHGTAKDQVQQLGGYLVARVRFQARQAGGDGGPGARLERQRRREAGRPGC